MLIKPDGTAAEKKRESLSRQDVKVLTDFEKWLERHHLSFALYCRRCSEAHLPSGCWGNNETTDRQYVVECACTKRAYDNPGASDDHSGVIH